MPPQPSPPPPDEAEHRLNALFHECFATPSGREVLAYLRRMTIETVGGPETSNDTLRHMEGQRFIVAVIEQRRAMHAKHQKDLLNAPKPAPRSRVATRFDTARGSGPGSDPQP